MGMIYKKFGSQITMTNIYSLKTTVNDRFVQ